ncbi:hypothetical protein [Ureibacillus acetophenoni]
MFRSQRRKNLFINFLLKEQKGREQAKIARNLKQARFIDTKTLETYEWHKDISLPKHLSKEELMKLDFIDEMRI